MENSHIYIYGSISLSGSVCIGSFMLHKNSCTAQNQLDSVSIDHHKYTFKVFHSFKLLKMLNAYH
jgi:hypothetical protein